MDIKTVGTVGQKLYFFNGGITRNLSVKKIEVMSDSLGFRIWYTFDKYRKRIREKDKNGNDQVFTSEGDVKECIFLATLQNEKIKK